ncbi:hypothetical protein ScalyP_jg1026 [Parmales sp. scaly parma]|nr:hypothetical protein ScalyP_jg1026 [Parmales sp. scaly parma]
MDCPPFETKPIQSDPLNGVDPFIMILSPSSSNETQLKVTNTHILESEVGDVLESHIAILDKTIASNSDHADLSDTVIPLTSLLLEKFGDSDIKNINRVHSMLCEVADMGVWSIEGESSTSLNSASKLPPPPTN